MIKSSFILIFCTAALFACKESATEKTTATDSVAVKQNESAVPAPQQTSDTSAKLYWEQLPLQTVAQLILKDSIRPVTKPVVYSMMDSLGSDIKSTRHYYFKVFNKIMNKADGELAESIGGYALTYVQNHPKEFLENSSSFSRNQLEAWSGNIGIEIFLSTNQNVKDAFDQIIVLFNDNCRDCSAAQRRRLNDFTNMIWRTIKDNQQADAGQG